MALDRQGIVQRLHRIGLYRPVRWGYVRVSAAYWLAVDWLTGRSRRALRAYLRRPSPHGLHIGCQDHCLDGWFNTDRVPNRRRLRLNAAKRFPYPDGTFDFVFAEHVIEHLSYAEGQIMLAECRRVLKPGGTLRIVTPDLRFLVDLYRNPDTGIHRQYVDWAGDRFLDRKTPRTAAAVVNNFFRDWGHRFIYDVAAMRRALQSAGFDTIVEAAIGRSEHPPLRDLEHERRMPPGFLALESMVLEAGKSAET